MLKVPSGVVSQTFVLTNEPVPEVFNSNFALAPGSICDLENPIESINCGVFCLPEPASRIVKSNWLIFCAVLFVPLPA